MSDRPRAVENQGPREPGNPPVAKPRTRGTRSGRASQRKRAAWQRFVFVDSLESKSGAYIDPSHVPFLGTDGSSRAYRFLAPEVAPEYTDISQVESTPEPEQTTSASSSSRVVITPAKPAAKKALTREIPAPLGAGHPEGGGSSSAVFFKAGEAPGCAEAYELAVLEYPIAAFYATALAKARGKAKAKGSDRPQPSKAKAPVGPPPSKARPKVLVDCSRSREEAVREDPNPGLELDLELIDPRGLVDLGQGSGFQIFDLNSGRSVRVHQRTIASYHWLDFHNVLDVSRTRVHVSWQGPFPQLFEDVKRALVRLHFMCKRTNGAFCLSTATAAPIPPASKGSKSFPTHVRHSLVKQVKTCFTSFASPGALQYRFRRQELRVGEVGLAACRVSRRPRGRQSGDLRQLRPLGVDPSHLREVDVEEEESPTESSARSVPGL